MVLHNFCRLDTEAIFNRIVIEATFHLLINELHIKLNGLFSYFGGGLCFIWKIRSKRQL